MKEFPRFHRGQLVIILNLLLPSLIAALVLGPYATTSFLNRIQLQRSIDAAVVVGASYLPSNPSLAISAAQSYANLKGIKTGDIVSTRISSNRASITMSARRAASCYFARALSLSIAPISATATASIATPASRVRGAAIRIHYGQFPSVGRFGRSAGVEKF
jgi:hypothetical protein